METGKNDPRDRPLWEYDGNGNQNLLVPFYEYQELSYEAEEQRFLVLQPAVGDFKDPVNQVRCEIKTLPLAEAPPFVAVNNARGYRLLQNPIEVNGRALFVSVALEAFLRHFRTWISEPTTLWIRHICVRESFPEEQKRYWTREWSDKMYSLAKDVVDMHSFNAKLIEEGQTLKVVEHRYMSWTKQWNDIPEPVLPTVYPIRLGQSFSNESPSCDFKYVPLDLIADEIRVLVLVPSGSDPSSTIVIHAAHCPIKCEVTYVALSYHWGNDSTTAEIVLNGQKKQIPKTLDDILRTLRMKNHPVCIWVDNISINQDDILEKSRQIPRMGEIFDNAAIVMGFIGRHVPHTDLALELIIELQIPMVRFNDKREWHFGDWGMKENGPGLWYGDNPIGPDRLPLMCAALYKLLTQRYFRRLWVCQEMGKASSPLLVLNDRSEIRFERLDKALHNFLDMIRTDLTLPGAIMEADSSIESIDTSLLAFPRKLHYFRHILSGGENTLMLFRHAKIRKRSPGFLEALILARDFECSDPRDKIFALWNVAQDKEGLQFEVNYAISTRHMYLDFTRAWIRQHSSLDILATAEALNGDSTFAGSLPSWCPDWSTPSRTSCLVRRERIPVHMMAIVDDQDGSLYSADGLAQPESIGGPPLFEFDGDVLYCTGIILDEISFVLDDPGDSPVGTLFPMGCEPESYYRAKRWKEEILGHYSANSVKIYDDPEQAVTAMFHGDVPTAWPRAEDNLEACPEPGPNEKYTCKTAESRHILYYAGGYRRTDAWETVSTVLRGRRPFISRDGYMGLAPTLAADHESGGPWLLAIVAGCSTPLLLRERDDGSYHHCGSCFVQGWMEGEVLAEALGADQPGDIWETLREGDKLKIS